MIPAERMKEITELLYEKKNVSIKKKKKKIYASPSTIRRDLIYLEKAGVLRRTRGGATLVSLNTSEFSSYVRSQENIEKKQKIVKIAFKFVQDDLSMYMDSSSTVHLLCDYLFRFKNLIIITNSILIPNRLINHDDIHVFCSGGVLKPHSHSLIGDMSHEFLSYYTPDLCFLSCKAINEEGIFEADFQQTNAKKTMIKNNNKVILLVDSTKFHKNAFIKISSLEHIDYIVTDKKPSEFEKYPDEYKAKFIWDENYPIQ